MSGSFEGLLRVVWQLSKGVAPPPASSAEVFVGLWGREGRKRDPETFPLLPLYLDANVDMEASWNAWGTTLFRPIRWSASNCLATTSISAQLMPTKLV